MTRFWQTATLLIGALAMSAGAETLTWNVQTRYGITASGVRQAIQDARNHFDKGPNDVVVLEFDEGVFDLEDQGDSKGTIDLSGIKPGPNGRLVFQGKGIDKTTLVFGDSKHAIYGRDVYRVTMADMHMTRKDYTVSQGLVVETGPGKVVLDIQEGFPTPADIFDPSSNQGRYLRRYTNSQTDPELVEKDNAQIPWKSANHLKAQQWEIELARNKSIGELHQRRLGRDQVKTWRADILDQSWIGFPVSIGQMDAEDARGISGRIQ